VLFLESIYRKLSFGKKETNLIQIYILLPANAILCLFIIQTNIINTGIT